MAPKLVYSFLHSSLSDLHYPILTHLPFSRSFSTILSIQSRNLNDESKTHIHLLNKVESDMTAESIALRAGNPRPYPIMHQYLQFPHHLPTSYIPCSSNKLDQTLCRSNASRNHSQRTIRCVLDVWYHMHGIGVVDLLIVHWYLESMIAS